MEWITGLVLTVSDVTNAGEFEIIWRIPFTRIGFYVIQALRKAGKSGIERKENWEKVFKLLRSKNAKKTEIRI